MKIFITEAETVTIMGNYARKPIRIDTHSWSTPPESVIAYHLGKLMKAKEILEEIVHKSEDKGVQIPDFVTAKKETVCDYYYRKKSYVFLDNSEKEIFEVKITKKGMQWYQTEEKSNKSHE